MLKNDGRLAKEGASSSKSQEREIGGDGTNNNEKGKGERTDGSEREIEKEEGRIKEEREGGRKGLVTDVVESKVI